MAVSETDYRAYYYDWPEITYEWRQGQLEEKGVSNFGTLLVFQWFVALLGQYLKSRGGGVLTNQEFGFSLWLDTHKKSIRRPDAGLILPSNPKQLRHQDRAYDGIFDLCIEAISDSDAAQKQRDTVIKCAEYAKVSVTEYYILAERLCDCHFYSLGSSGNYESLSSDVNGVFSSKVLQGFRWRERDLLTRPDFDDLTEDPVYRPYVQLALTAARHEKEETLALVARERAEKERLRKLLQQAGIDPDRRSFD